jgi:hypothetical protein
MVLQMQDAVGNGNDLFRSLAQGRDVQRNLDD